LIEGERDGEQRCARNRHRAGQGDPGEAGRIVYRGDLDAPSVRHPSVDVVAEARAHLVEQLNLGRERVAVDVGQAVIGTQPHAHGAGARVEILVVIDEPAVVGVQELGCRRLGVEELPVLSAARCKVPGAAGAAGEGRARASARATLAGLVGATSGAGTGAAAVLVVRL